MEILFPFWSCPKICNQNVKRVNWIMKFPGCNFTEKGRIAKPGYHFTDYRALWYNRTFDHQHIVQDNTIQETLANWWQMIFQTIFYTIWMVSVRCNLTHGQNCLVAMFSNLRIYLKFCRHQIKYLMIIGGRVDLNNLQRIQRDQISVNIVCRRRDEKWKDIYKCCWIWQTCLWDWRWFRSRTRLTKLSLIIWGNIENAVYLKGVGRFLMVDYEKERRGSLARDGNWLVTDVNTNWRPKYNPSILGSHLCFLNWVSGALSYRYLWGRWITPQVVKNATNHDFHTVCNFHALQQNIDVVV